jgi:hypothetical protein
VELKTKNEFKKIKEEINENNASTTSVIHEISLIGTSK